MPNIQNFNISKHWLYQWFEILITDGFIKHQNCLTYFKLPLWSPLFSLKCLSNQQREADADWEEGCEGVAPTRALCAAHCCVAPEGGGIWRTQGNHCWWEDKGKKSKPSPPLKHLRKNNWHKRNDFLCVSQNRPATWPWSSQRKIPMLSKACPEEKREVKTHHWESANILYN